MIAVRSSFENVPSIVCLNPYDKGNAQQMYGRMAHDSGTGSQNYGPQPQIYVSGHENYENLPPPPPYCT